VHTVVVDVRIASVSYPIIVRVVLIQIRYGRTVVTSIAFFVRAILIGIHLVRVGHQRTVVLYNDRKISKLIFIQNTSRHCLYRKIERLLLLLQSKKNVWRRCYMSDTQWLKLLRFYYNSKFSAFLGIWNRDNVKRFKICQPRATLVSKSLSGRWVLKTLLI